MFFAMGPVTTVGSIESPVWYLAYITPELRVGLFGFYSL